MMIGNEARKHWGGAGERQLQHCHVAWVCVRWPRSIDWLEVSPATWVLKCSAMRSICWECEKKRLIWSKENISNIYRVSILICHYVSILLSMPLSFSFLYSPLHLPSSSPSSTYTHLTILYLVHSPVSPSLIDWHANLSQSLSTSTCRR